MVKISATVYNDVEPIKTDILFATKQRYLKDTRGFKVDLGVGAYRADNGKPWILPSVRKAERLVQEEDDYDHEYLNICGLDSLTNSAAKVILGEDCPALRESRVVSVQSLSGAGALHVAAKFIKKYTPEKKIYLSNPTWPIHQSIFENVDLETDSYPYWDATNKSLDFEGFIKAIDHAPRGSIFVLHACAHNPTGLDPTQEQWHQIIESIQKGDHIPLFDSAYQGFASGDLERDAYAIRYTINQLRDCAPIFVAQSFAKNVGMYGERVGCLHLVLPAQKEDIVPIKDAITSQLSRIIRSEISTPPAYGAKVVSKIFTTPELKEQWYQDLVTMSSRIISVRTSLRDLLVEYNTPGNWDHIVQQCGMFSFTGLTPEMTKRLETEHAVYMVPTGRASVAGLNTGNVQHVAKAINEVVNHFLKD